MKQTGLAVKALDLDAQMARIGADLERRMATVMAHQRFIMGPEVEELETALAKRVGAGAAIGCASGTDALVMALLALGVERGDRVIVPDFSFFATAEAVVLCGADPVFADIDPETYNLDPDSLATVVEQQRAGPDAAKLKGMIAVDLFGLPADYDRINAFARQHGLFVVADAAQSFGALYRGRPVGVLADITTASFFPSKPFGCFGDGGCLFTDDPETAARLRSIRQHGMGDSQYENVRIGLNGRLDTLQAAVLLAKLSILDDELERRQRIADRLTASLSGQFTTPIRPEDGTTCVYAQYVLRHPRRDALLTAANEAGLPLRVYYPKPLHSQPALLPYRTGGDSFPATEAACAEVFSPPLQPYLEDDEVDAMAEYLNDWAG